jgi:O-antigen ligase
MKRSTVVAYFVIAICILHLSPFPFWRNYVIGFLGIYTVLDKNSLKKGKDLFSQSIFWIALIPFAIYLVSIIHSDLIQSGLKEIEFKISLLLFPIFLGVTALNKSDFKLISKAVVAAITVLPIIGFFIQLQVVYQTGDNGWLYNDNLVSFINKQAVYYGFFVNVALLLLIYLQETDSLKKRFYKPAAIFSLFVLLATQYLLASRTSLLLTGFLLGGYVVFLIMKRLNTKQAVALVLGSCIVLFSLFALFPKVVGRFNSITNLEYRYDNPNPINHYNGELKKENWNGLNTRLAIWNCAWEEVKAAPVFGYGLGDVQQQLVKNYKEKNFILGLNSNYNTHNQYLDLLLMSGFAGLISFILFIILVLGYSIKQKNYLLAGFTIVFCLSCLTENLLNRDQGAVFVALIFSLLIYKKEESEVVQILK